MGCLTPTLKEILVKNGFAINAQHKPRDFNS
jgi:hypothetical protein